MADAKEISAIGLAACILYDMLDEHPPIFSQTSNPTPPEPALHVNKSNHPWHPFSSSSRMNTNLDLSLRDLHSTHPKHHDLVTQLLHIQDTYLLHNLKSLTWITNLACLTTHNPLARKRKHDAPSPASTHTLTRTTVNGRTGAYIAISYPWSPSPLPTTTDSPRTGTWRIQASTASRAHSPSAVRDAVLARASRCAAALACANVWIDRECVPQAAGPENEAALHTMDLVYQFSDWPVALLFEPVASERALRVFERVMGRALLQARRGGAGDALREGIAPAEAAEALAVLRGVTRDPWWERAWTFQENYCAGAKMSLLIPLKDRRWWRKRRKGEGWRTGDVPGELLVSSVEFHKAATRFCLAYLKSDFISDAQREACRGVLRKAGRYFYTMLDDGTVGVTEYSRTMTTRILEDIAHRNAQFRADLLPIASNCCQYGARLDTNRLYDSDTNLSICILALWLLNGEIFKSDVSHTTSELAEMSIFQYLKAISLDSFAPPVQGRQLTFLKTCRFVDVQFSDYGVTTSGWLWKVDRHMSTKDPKFRRQRQHRKVKTEQSHSEPAEPLLKVLADELRSQGFHGLAALLDRNDYFQSQTEKRGGKEEGKEKRTPAEIYMSIAANHLERGIAKGHSVLLARLWDGQADGEDDGTLPSHTAIFLGERAVSAGVRESPRVHTEQTVQTETCYESESCSGPSFSSTSENESLSQPFVSTYAFTAWSGRSEDDDRNVEESQIDKYVSLEVAVDEERANGIPLLRTKRWLNGLCFFSREAEMDVTFAWPPGLRNDLEKEADAG